MNAAIRMKMRTDQVSTPSLEVGRLDIGNSWSVQAKTTARYMPSMKSSDWAKFPYLCTLYVRVRPIAIARYVDDHVRVPVPIDTESRVNEALTSSPCIRKSRVRNVRATMKKGEIIKPIVLANPEGASSNRIFTTMNPALIDCTTCRIQTMSLGSPPPRILSSRFRDPNPFRVPIRFASRKRNVARISLRAHLGSSENLSRASCSMYYTCPEFTRIKIWGSAAGNSPPHCFS